MNHFCTLFDSGYLTRGLALYDSLVTTRIPFFLYIYCFDDLSLSLLRRLSLPNVKLISLTEFETIELIAVKSSRSRGEYCWTCTPFVIADSLKRYSLDEVTYLDADLYFFSSPEVLLDEFRASGSSVLLTEHRYSPEYNQSLASGIYCVQFMTFSDDHRGRRALEWWKARCLEWCFNRIEDGKFGDQKYLDDWPTRFEGVHVLKHYGGGLAPWNINEFYSSSVFNSETVPVIFYHFHALKWFYDNTFDLAYRYRIPKRARKEIYEPYLRALQKALKLVQSIDSSFDMGKVDTPKFGLRKIFSRMRRIYDRR